ncbi:MAG TPA: ACP S-malonyltransferase [Polyangia bacterium]|nr:ACP S-malonyltransferase [Polyangia bacterium]
MKTAFVFPGQGAQKVGMGGELLRESAAARAVFEEADEALGEPLSRLILDGPAEDLQLTANTQPAILTVSIAALRAFEERCGFRPDYVAGHSLGEYSALVAAGALGFGDTVRTTRARGTFMQEAVPAGEGAMAAVVGKESGEVAAACVEAATGEVVAPANFNAPDQIVISGSAMAVERASRLLAGSGARVIPLKVSAPFHCGLMQPAAARLDEFLAGVAIGEPRLPVVANVTAEPNSDASHVRELLVRQVTSPVRWTETVRFLLGQGVRRFVEFGPGNVLAGLIRKVDRDVDVVSVGTPDGVHKALAAVTAA